jgi:hypothetical protein
MPSLQSPGRDAISSISKAPEALENTPLTKPWITAIIVVGSVLLVTALVTGVILHLEQQKMGAAGRQREEEMQRNIIIRKSLASRSFGSSSHSGTESLAGERCQSHATGLKEDWKNWEVTMTSERTRLESQHPLASMMADRPDPCPSRLQSSSSASSLRKQHPRLQQPSQRGL